METYQTPDATKRLARVLLSSGELGRPFIAPPGMAADQVKILRDGFSPTSRIRGLKKILVWSSDWNRTVEVRGTGRIVL
jgi:hypothetical protein